MTQVDDLSRSPSITFDQETSLIVVVEMSQSRDRPEPGACFKTGSHVRLCCTEAGHDRAWTE